MPLTVSDLRPADIVLTMGSSLVSYAIAFGSGARYSHAMLHAGNGHFIHAIGEGVVRQGFGKVMEDVGRASVYRHAPQPTREQRERIVATATFYTADGDGQRDYDYREVVGAGNPLAVGLLSPALGSAVLQLRAINLAFGNRERLFCSELIVAAYQSSGLDLGGRNPSSYSPGALGRNARLHHVGELALP